MRAGIPSGDQLPLLSSQGAPGAAPVTRGVLLGALLLAKNSTHTRVCVQGGTSLIMEVEIDIPLSCAYGSPKNLEVFL